MSTKLTQLVNRYDKQVRGCKFTWHNMLNKPINCTAQGAIVDCGDVLIQAVDSIGNEYLVSPEWLLK